MFVVLFPHHGPTTEHVDHHGAPYLYTFPPACLPRFNDTFDDKTGSVYGEPAVCSLCVSSTNPSGWGVTQPGAVSDVIKETQVDWPKAAISTKPAPTVCAGGHRA